MHSGLAWMDYSQKQRRQVMDVMSLLSEPGSVDELGVGTVRDAFSDLLFPGISTIQTRARYFLFIPWIYLDLEARGIRASQVPGFARDREISLIRGLIRGGENRGVIGIEAGKNLKRLPSEIYWQGLMAWGIRLFPGSRDQYHRHLDRHYRSGIDGPASEAEIAVPSNPNWHAGLPRSPRGFPSKASFALTREEAEYLMDRIFHTCPGTLLAYLLRMKAQDVPGFPWEHPVVTGMPSHLEEQLFHARNFSQVMHGAMLLYNLYLARLVGRQDWADRFRGNVSRWWDGLKSIAEELRGWDRGRFWDIVLGQNRRIHLFTRNFVDSWSELALNALWDGGSVGSLTGSPDVRQLLVQREVQIKRGRARLANGRAREMWGGNSGTAQLSYRWPVARTILRDILQPLGGEIHA